MSYTFGVGFNDSLRSAHVSTDKHGRTIDPVAETETQRNERIRDLQDGWTPTQVPTTPAAVAAEWMRDPRNRMSPLGMRIGENSALLPELEVEPQPGQAPIPGGLHERVYATVAERMERAGRNWNR